MSSSSHDSNFSDAALFGSGDRRKGGTLKHHSPSRKKPYFEVDDSEFAFVNELSNRRDVLGVDGLGQELDAIRTPTGGGRKKKTLRGRIHSFTESRRRPHQLKATSTAFLDRAADQQRTGWGNEGNESLRGKASAAKAARSTVSLTGTPARRRAADKICKASKAQHSPNWISAGRKQRSTSRMTLGMVGDSCRMPPSTVTAKQRSRETLVELASSSDDERGNALGHVEANQTKGPAVYDEYPHKGFSLPNQSGSRNHSESPDLSIAPSPSRKKKRRRIQGFDDEVSRSSPSSVGIVRSVQKFANWISKAGFESGVETKNTTNSANKRQKIIPGKSLVHSENFDEIESYDSEGQKMDLHPSRPRRSRASYGEKRGVRGRSNGIDAKKFHRRNGTQSHEDSSQTTLATKRRSPRFRPEKKKEVIQIEDSSSDESEDDFLLDENQAIARAKRLSLEDHAVEKKVRKIASRYKVDCVRVAVGKKVFSQGCILSFQPGTAEPFIRLAFRKPQKDLLGSAQNESMPGKKKLCDERVITFTVDLIDEMKYFLADQNAESDEAELEPLSSISSTISESNAMSILAIRVDPGKVESLASFSNAYLQDVEGATEKDLALRKFIVVELRSDAEFETEMLEPMRRIRTLAAFLDQGAQMQRCDVKRYTTAFVQDDKREQMQRLALPQKRRTRSRSCKIDGSKDGNTLLVFPFDANAEVFHEACKDLKETRGQIPRYENGRIQWENPRDLEGSKKDGGLGDEDDYKESSTLSSSRTHYLTIRGDDFDRLDHGEFLNDTLVDFWMTWISRNEDPENSNVHFFTSHFFSTLDDEGPEAVSSWTEKKGIDIFAKKFVFIPINQSLHWSLCVVVNPGFILNEFNEDGDDNDDFPCILFLDSLKAHKKTRIASRIRNWLNHQFTRLNKFSDVIRNDAELKKPFTKDTMEVFDPRIPYQDNSWDCGVFVCRYAYALYVKRKERITYRDLGESRPYLHGVITDSAEFNFNMADIRRLREEMKTLIRRLSVSYVAMKKREEKARKERKMKKIKIAAESVAAHNFQGQREKGDKTGDVEESVGEKEKVEKSEKREVVERFENVSAGSFLV